MRHDASRSLVCCVEVVDAERVSVTDFVTTVEPGGRRTRLGAYPKLRLAPADIAASAAAAGLRLDRQATEQGMLLQVLRPSS